MHRLSRTGLIFYKNIVWHLSHLPKTLPSGSLANVFQCLIFFRTVFVALSVVVFILPHRRFPNCFVCCFVFCCSFVVFVSSVIAYCLHGRFIIMFVARRVLVLHCLVGLCSILYYFMFRLVTTMLCSEFVVCLL